MSRVAEGGPGPGVAGRSCSAAYVLGHRGRQDSKGFASGCRTAKGRRFRRPRPRKWSAEAPVRTRVITASTSGTTGPSRCGRRRVWPHSVLTVTGKPGIFTSPVARRENRGTKGLDDFPKVAQLMGGTWRFRPTPRGAGPLSGGARPPPPRPHGTEEHSGWDRAGAPNDGTGAGETRDVHTAKRNAVVSRASVTPCFLTHERVSKTASDGQHVTMFRPHGAPGPAGRTRVPDAARRCAGHGDRVAVRGEA